MFLFLFTDVHSILSRFNEEDFVSGSSFLEEVVCCIFDFIQTGMCEKNRFRITPLSLLCQQGSTGTFWKKKTRADLFWGGLLRKLFSKEGVVITCKCE